MSEIGGAVHAIDGVMWNIGGLISIHSMFVDNRAMAQSEGAGWGVPLAAQSAPCARAPCTLMHVAPRRTRRATAFAHCRRPTPCWMQLISSFPMTLPCQNNTARVQWVCMVLVMFATMQFIANNHFCTLMDYYSIVYVSFTCACACT